MSWTPGIWELIVILLILLLVFGPRRLADLGSSLGKGIRGFRRSLKEEDSADTGGKQNGPDSGN